MKAPTTTVTASNGVPFLLRLIRQGDPYGMDFCRIHDEDPVIEFYDTRHPFTHDHVGTEQEAIAAGAPVLGQFVSRYHLSTLQERDPSHGLDLHGSEPAWKIDGQALATGLAAMEEALLSPHTPDTHPGNHNHRQKDFLRNHLQVIGIGD